MEVSSRPTGALPLRHKFTYAAGALGVALIAESVLAVTPKFYHGDSASGRPMFTPLALLGVALLVGRLVDALADPLVGYWSDHTRSRWGRRKPFIGVGAPLLVAALILMYCPPVYDTSTLNFVYLTILLSLTLFLFTVVVCPYLAMLPEISRLPGDRVQLSSLQGFFQILGTALGMVLPWPLAASFGYPAMTTVMGLVALACFLLPLGVPMASSIPAPEGTQPKGPGLLESLKLTWRNQSFRAYVGGYFFLWFAFRILIFAAPFLVTEVLGRPESEVGLVLAWAIGSAIVCLPLVPILAGRFPKRSLLLGTMLFFAAAAPLLGTVGKWPLPISPLVQTYIICAICGIPLAAFFGLPYAIFAEVIDRDAQQTGMRREALYYGVQGLLIKAGIGLAGLFAAQHLSLLGGSAENPLGIRTAGIWAAVFTLVGFFVFRKYPVRV